MACQKQLKWYHLVPVVSFLVLRGRCGFCGSRISLQYPVVELVTAVAFAMVGLVGLPLVPQVIAYLCIALLVAISVYDIKHTIILNQWVYSFAALALLYAITLMMPQSAVEWATVLLSGPLIAFPLWALWFVSKGTWMGFGDVKLALGIGWFLGPFYGLVALFGAFILGAIISVSLLILLPRFLAILPLHKHSLVTSHAGFTMKSEVPFGPFLTCSCFIVWFVHSMGILIPFVLF